MKIWKRQYNPFKMGGELTEKVSTEIADDTPKHDLGKGFDGVIIIHNGKSYVFEATSGGLVGDSLDSVRNDIEECEDIKFMQKQIEESIKLRDTALEISYEEFFNNVRL